ncbi:uncharacterized protein [Paramormyrops kingsleyae]|uniref:uncharacterized protein n=1 Tax=Paramormyrops kingsleyae TaxID=1676925 RepID=UPI003B96ED18
MTAWEVQSLSEPSFARIDLPPPTTHVPLPLDSPHVPEPMGVPAISPAHSPLAVTPPGTDKFTKVFRNPLPQCRPPRLPPLRPITNTSFSRSFTFSFFQLPLHLSTRGRAERISLPRQVQN